MSKYILTLYVTGRTSRSERAIRNLKEICAGLPEKYEIDIIDVLDNPDKAEDDKILATPTLIKKLPPPIRRIIGDLSVKDKVLYGLDLDDNEGRTGGENDGK